jgi:hypothetical protein
VSEVNEAALEALLLRDERFAELESRLQLFCPFEATGMVRQEIRHGAFLTYVLDPNRPHGFGTECLRALMTAAASAIPPEAGVSPLDAYLMDYQGAVVGQWRNIDILLRLPAADVVVAIELKIDASEHGTQLKRYRERVEAEWPHARRLFLFLTKHGDDPSEDHGEGWYPLELEAVIEELDRVVRRGAGTEAARAMLAAYVAMMRRIHLTDERMEELARELWARHREALAFLAEREPNPMGEVMKIIGEKSADLARRLSAATGLTVIPDDASGNTIVRFAVKEWDEVEGMRGKASWTRSQRLVLAEICAYKDGKVQGMIVLGRGDDAARQSLYKRLKTSGEVKNATRLSPAWKRLASKRLFTAKPEEEEFDPAEVAERVAAAFIKEMAPLLKAFDAALRPSSLESAAT